MCWSHNCLYNRRCVHWLRAMGLLWNQETKSHHHITFCIKSSIESFYKTGRNIYINTRSWGCYQDIVLRFLCCFRKLVYGWQKKFTVIWWLYPKIYMGNKRTYSNNYFSIYLFKHSNPVTNNRHGYNFIYSCVLNLKLTSHTTFKSFHEYRMHHRHCDLASKNGKKYM